jgi:hypothetical protein
LLGDLEDVFGISMLVGREEVLDLFDKVDDSIGVITDILFDVSCLKNFYLEIIFIFSFYLLSNILSSNLGTNSILADFLSVTKRFVDLASDILQPLLCIFGVSFRGNRDLISRFFTSVDSWATVEHVVVCISAVLL